MFSNVGIERTRVIARDSLLVLGEGGLEGGEVVLGTDDGIVGKPVGEGRR